jgi:hypothetical protein
MANGSFRPAHAIDPLLMTDRQADLVGDALDEVDLSPGG